MEPNETIRWADRKQTKYAAYHSLDLNGGAGELQEAQLQSNLAN